ncbi:unnamed protein product, partial [Polarella glacialis]
AYSKTELFSSGEVWRTTMSHAGYPLGMGSFSEAASPNFVVSGERPPSAIVAAEAAAAAKVAAAIHRAQGHSAAEPDEVVDAGNTSTLTLAARPGIANIDMMSFAYGLPAERGRA